MGGEEYLGVKEAAQFEGVSPGALLARARRKHVIMANDSDDGRRKLFPVSALSSDAVQRRVKEQVSAALQGMAGKAQDAPPSQQNPEQAITLATERGKPLQPFLAFAPPSPSEAARDAVVAAVPSKFRDYVDKWTGIIADCDNGTYKKFSRGAGMVGSWHGIEIRNNDDFMRALALDHKISLSNIYQKRAIWRETAQDPRVLKAHPKDRPGIRFRLFSEAIVPKHRPGRASAAFFARPENGWLLLKLREFYLNQAKLSAVTAHGLLLLEVDAKQRAWGIDHIYDKPTLGQSKDALSQVIDPTLNQVRTALQKIKLPELILGREGVEAYRNKIEVSLSRQPLEISNRLWCTDQREVDVRMRDGGERLGRIWMVNFLDVASFKVLGYSFGPVLNSDMVMQAGAMAIARYGVPEAIQMDLGKEFTFKGFSGGVRRINGEALFREAMSLCGYLNIRPVKSIGNNPQTKPIERWHQIPAKWEKNFPGWCGSNTDERPEKLKEEEAMHAEWLAGHAPRSPLVTIGQYIRAYVDWVENRWNAKHRGKGKTLRGMTPNEAFNVKKPGSGFRFISEDELDHAAADHRTITVSRGGQVNLTFYGQTIEYISPDLFNHIGEEAEVIVSRRTFRQVTVIYPVLGGTASCIATLKLDFEWLPENRDELRAALRCRAATRRAVREGVKASNRTLEASNPVELLALASQEKPLPGQKLFGTPGPRPEQEISGAEWTMARLEKNGRGRFASDIVRKALEMEAET